MIFEYKKKAKSNSYKNVNGTPVKRSAYDIDAIVIHYTGGTTDTAKNECDYFASGNTRSAGAHCFIDRAGICGRSIPHTYIAWSVGDSSNGHGAYYNLYNNSNTISIELCAIAKEYPTSAQIKKLKQMIRYYCKKCPNIKNIVRHYDITTKICPEPYCGTTKKDAKWQLLKNELMEEMRKVRC